MVNCSAFPLIPGNWMISTGTFLNVKAIRAFEETVITVTALNDSTQNYTLPAGTDTSIGFPTKNIIVVSGVASIANNSLA